MLSNIMLAPKEWKKGKVKGRGKGKGKGKGKGGETQDAGRQEAPGSEDGVGAAREPLTCVAVPATPVAVSSTILMTSSHHLVQQKRVAGKVPCAICGKVSVSTVWCRP